MKTAAEASLESSSTAPSQMTPHLKHRVDLVISQVLIEERLKQLSSGQTALAAKAGDKGKGKALENKKKKKCCYCKLMGHLEREC